MRLFISLLLTFSFLLMPTYSLASEVASPSSEPIQKPSSSYTLPYPGMLPDNPLYSLKMLRDRIVLFLIADPVKKAEFNLLQADKRLQAGVSLWQQKPEKAELTISTISKAENYFEQAIIDTKQAIKEGRETGAIKGDLIQASQKHTEVIKGLQEKMPEEYDHSLNILISRTQGFAKQVSAFK